MARPHPALMELAAERPPGRVDDPVALVMSAREHRLQGLVWHAVERNQLTVSKDVSTRLAEEVLAIRAQNMRLWRTWEDIVDRLAAANIQVAGFKGVAAESRWYPDLGTRPCKDLDLLLDPAQQSRIEEVVRLLQPNASMLPDVAVLVENDIIRALDLLVNGVEVDFHLDVLKLEVPMRAPRLLWERTTTIATPAGRSVHVLDAEMSLVHFLIHLNKDRFAQLLGYADVARLLRRENIDWTAVDRFVRAEGLAVPVYASLEHVCDTLALPVVPTGRTVSVGGVRAALWRRLWPASASLQGYAGIATRRHRQLALPFLAEGRVRESLRWWLRRRAFPPRSLMEHYLPQRSGPYWWRVMSGRARHLWQARSVVKDLRRHS